MSETEAEKIIENEPIPDEVISAWLGDPKVPAPDINSLIRFVRSDDQSPFVAIDGNLDTVAILRLAQTALRRDQALKAKLDADEAIEKDVTRKGAYDAIDKIVEQRNHAERQTNFLIRDLYQIAVLLLCEPSQSGVINAIISLRQTVQDMDKRIGEMSKQLEDAYGEIDSLNDQLTDANEALELAGEALAGEDA
jgi:hypothetical protein